MGNVIHCPKCGGEFELSTLMREQLEAEVRAHLQVDFERRIANAAAATDARLREKDQELEAARGKLADAATKETALLKKQRELADRERDLALDVERRVAEEAKRIRDEETKAARERFGREAEQRVQQKEEELADVRGKLASASSREAEVLKKQRELEARERELTLDVERRVAAEAKRIRDEEGKAARERAARETAERVREKDEALEETRRKLAETTQREADALKKQRELEDRERALAVDFERRVAEQSKQAREQEAKLAEQRAELEREQQRLRDEEHRQQIDGLQKTIAELQRKVHQGSQQTQGEAQEVVLRDLLEDAFAGDSIEDVPKGVNGADVLHRVRAGEGRDCGAIIWESKRTKAWSDEWLPKLRDDQRAAGAACAIIVSQVMPADVRHFGVKDGVWICAWPYATALGAALRASLVEVALARRVAEGRGEKMQMLFDYLTGTEFRNRVEGFVEAFKQMQDDLESEKRAMLTRWNKRAKLMQRARDNITAFYGDLQGIAGRQIQDLPALALDPVRALPGVVGDADEDPDADEQPGDDELKELLFSLCPEDGATTGNGSLTERFVERALTELGVCVTADDYARCKAVLLAEGRIRKGKGKGGSVCRVRAGLE